MLKESVQDRMSLLRQNPLSRTLFAAFVVILCTFLPLLLNAARVADDKYQGTAPSDGDEVNYQSLAINLLHGKGFVEGIILPPETYHLDLTTPAGMAIRDRYEEYGPDEPKYTFYRTPGLPILLASLYAVFGNYTLIARQMIAIMVWLTAILMLLAGLFLDKWRGSLAGGVVGILYLTFYVLLRPRDPFFESILAEGPATFFFVLIGFLLMIYLKRQHLCHLILAALALVATVYLRPNFTASIPLLLLYLLLTRRKIVDVAVFGAILLLPLIAWSTYVSLTLGGFVGFSTQSEVAFPEYNNMEVLEGVGPERLYQGQWNPGWFIEENGAIVNDYHNSTQPGESGWVKGLIFWRDHITQLPRLFFVKLRAGFWYSERGGVADQMRVRLYSLGIGFILLSVGLRSSARAPRTFPHIAAKYVLPIQLGLIAVLFLVGNAVGYPVVLILFATILLLALLHPYGDVYQPGFPSVVWFLCFMAGHAIVTLIFGGIRFHQPMDPFVLFYGLLGSIIVIDELVLKRRFGVVLDSQPSL